MARPLRIEYPGAFYHIIQRGTERKAIFKTDSDKKRFLSYFDNLPIRYHVRIHAYILLDNHYHLILETLQANLSKAIHYLDTSYAVYFNSKRKRVGPLYQGRYKAILVQEDVFLHHLSRYIHLNPVRAKIAQKPEDYTWSSYKYYVSGCNSPKWLRTDFILRMFAKTLLQSKRLYKNFVIRGIGQEKEIITENTIKGFLLGNKDFFEQVQDKFLKGKSDPEIPQIREIKALTEPSMEQISQIVKRNTIDNEKTARRLSIYFSRKFTQNKLREIATYHGGITDAAVSQLYSRVEQERMRNKKFNKFLVSIERILNVET